MPLSRTVARVNRYTINPVIRLFAGTVPPFAVLIHTGRTSGRVYRTPIMVFPSGDTFVIALTYGRGTDWERNVFHAGGCELIWRRQHIRLVRPELVDEVEAGVALPRLVRTVLSILGVRDFIRLERLPGA
jgi:deazaflavin-dependent oxidoreductase (nitroreductase family)